MSQENLNIRSRSWRRWPSPAPRMLRRSIRLQNRPIALARCSSLFLALAVTASALAQEVYVSATFNPEAGGNIEISSNQLLGSRFTVTTATDICAIGGNLRRKTGVTPDPVMFGAIVRLSNGVPQGSPIDEAEVVASITFTLSNQDNEDVRIPLTAPVPLAPGNYAVIFGSGFLDFPPGGEGVMPNISQTDTDDGMGSYIFWNSGANGGAGAWFDAASGFNDDGFRFVVVGPQCNEPPVISCPEALVVLWSPNHELVDVESAVVVSDPDDDPVTVDIRVFSDETEIPDTGDGTGRHAPDFKRVLASGDPGWFVRSERRGRGDGRFYIFVITASDGIATTTAVCAVAVCPHDQNDPASLDDVLAQAATAVGVVQDAVDNGDPLPPEGLTEHGLSGELGPHQ